MKLSYTGTASNSALLILHGLFGNKNNFSSILKVLVKKSIHFILHIDINSIALDLRNHGASEWAASSKVIDMANDVKDFIQEKNIEKVDILGHSLGGKVGMKLALEYPNLVNSLIVVDMSPFSKRNPTEMLTFVKEMKKVQEQYANRQDIKLALQKVVHDPMVLEFLMTNLVLKDDDSWKFRINLESLERDIPGMLQEEITRGK
jgi:pimeloyl-ACP methyl ester carboxylesterase